MTHLQYVVIIKWKNIKRHLELCLEHGKQNINISYFIIHPIWWLQKSNKVIEKNHFLSLAANKLMINGTYNYVFQ